MRKNIFGRQFKRDKDERKALFKSLLSELVLHGRIVTTEPKAKAIKADAEKMIKKARKELMQAQKLLSPLLIPTAIEKIVAEIAPRFVGRNGGYTRIIKLGRRFNDDAKMVILEWVEGTQSSKKGSLSVGAAVQNPDKGEQGTEKMENETTVKKRVTKRKTAEKPEKKQVVKKKTK